MSNPGQTVTLDVMIRRLEEANARAHERVAQAEERVSDTQQHVAPQDQQKSPAVQDQQKSPAAPDQQKSPAAPDRRSSRRRLALGLIGSLSAASLGVVAFVWQSSYLDAAKQIVARWAPVAHTTPQPIAPTAAAVSDELVERLQMMAQDLTKAAQGIEQLRTTQEQMARDNTAVDEQLKAALAQMTRDNATVGALKAALAQMTRDNAAVGEQLKTALSQMARDNAAVAEQLKAIQEQTVRLIATRSRHKPVPTLPSFQAQPQAAVYPPPSSTAIGRAIAPSR